MVREQTPRELMVIILDDASRLQAVLKGLYDAGVPGVTVLDSAGGYRTHSWLEDLGLGGIANLIQNRDRSQRMILTVMEQDLIDGAIAAAEQAVDGFGRPDSGLLFTIPVGYTVGLFKRESSQDLSEPVVSRLDVQIRDMPVKQAAALIKSDVVTVSSNATIAEGVLAMEKNSSTNVAAVVSREDHLLGLVTLRSLADHIFFGIMPELFLGEVFDQEHAEKFSKMTNVHIVSDCMTPPISVHAEDPVRTAFRLMHENELSGLPIVDDDNHVIAFLSLRELLALVIREEEIEHE
jgi:CBS domain-containing protein